MAEQTPLLSSAHHPMPWHYPICIPDGFWCKSATNLAQICFVLPPQSSVKHSLTVGPACKITFSALITCFKQNQNLSFLWGVLIYQIHLKASKLHEGMCLTYKHIDIHRQSYMLWYFVASLWDHIQNVTSFVKEIWLHFVETSIFAVMKLHSLRLWDSRVLNHLPNSKDLYSTILSLGRWLHWAGTVFCTWKGFWPSLGCCLHSRMTLLWYGAVPV